MFAIQPVQMTKLRPHFLSVRRWSQQCIVVIRTTKLGNVKCLINLKLNLIASTYGLPVGHITQILSNLYNNPMKEEVSTHSSLTTRVQMLIPPLTCVA